MLDEYVIHIPNNWALRPYQRPAWYYMQNGGLHGKRMALVWHRRAGKDAFSINLTAWAAMQRPGLYWHMAPTTAQARKIIWTGMSKEGVRYIDQAFPPTIRAKRPNDTEMKIELKNGSIWQCVGSDNYNSLVGANPVGMVWSEWSLADPMAWDYFRPMLLENGGWAVFIYTPRGDNHGKALLEAAQKNEWFQQVLTATDTGVFSPEQIEKERKELIAMLGADEADAIINQEYFCSFDASNAGAYYGSLLEAAAREGRICEVLYDAGLPVYTGWDLGVGDPAAIWFSQLKDDRINLIDYIESNGAGYDFYASEIKQRAYVLDTNYLPHDVRQREQTTGLSREEVLRQYNIGHIQVVPQSSIMSGITEARAVMNRCYFDAVKCKRGLDALRNYTKKFDEKNRCWSQAPVHNWASHGADAFRTLAQGLKYYKPVRMHEQPQVVYSNTNWEAF